MTRDYETQFAPSTEGLLFPPEVMAKAKVVKRCCHPRDARMVGPRVPAHYGSWATEVCTHCWSWRYAELNDKRWRGFADLVKRRESHDDES